MLPARPQASPRSFRDRIELGFARWGRSAARRPAPIIALSVLFAAFFIAQLPALEFDVSDEGFLREDDPVRITYEAFKRQFGREASVLIALEPREVFDFEFLAMLKTLHAEPDALPQLENVTSLVNAPTTDTARDTGRSHRRPFCLTVASPLLFSRSVHSVTPSFDASPNRHPLPRSITQ